MIAAWTAGACGAVTTTLLHEVVRRCTPEAPRVDLLGMQALAKMFRAGGAKAPAGRQLYVLTLLGDVASNSAYFALVALEGRARAVRNGALLGVAAGIGAFVLPPRLGLDPVTTNRTELTRALTVALYAAGGVTAGAVFAALARATEEADPES